MFSTKCIIYSQLHVLQFKVEIAKSFDVPYECEEDIDPPNMSWDPTNYCVPGPPNLIDFVNEKPPLMNPNAYNAGVGTLQPQPMGNPGMYPAGATMNQPPYPMEHNPYQPYPQKKPLPDNDSPMSMPPKYEEYDGSSSQETAPPLPPTGPCAGLFLPDIPTDNYTNPAPPPGSGSVDFDDLNRRFEELKRRP